MKSYTVRTKEQAWTIANDLFKGDYEYDTQASANAGYDIYMSTNKVSNDHVSDLGCRLEVNIGIESINIWIEEEPETVEETAVTAATVPNTTVVELNLKYSSYKGIFTGAYTTVEETYFFHDYEEDELEKGLKKIIRFMSKCDSTLYIKTYNSDDIPAGCKYHYFATNRNFGRGTLTLCDYPTGSPESYNWNDEREYAPKQACERLTELARSLYWTPEHISI